MGDHEKSVGRVEIRYHTILHHFRNGTGVRDIADAIDILLRNLTEAGMCCLRPQESHKKSEAMCDLKVIECRTHIPVCRKNNSCQSCIIILDLSQHHLSHQRLAIQ